MTNKVIITILSVVFIIGFLLLAYKMTNAPTVTVFPQVNVIKADDHIKWSPNKKNILVEYSDLQCPACKEFQDLIQSQFEASGSAHHSIVNGVTFVYRHFPLYQIHPFAYDASYAAEAAGKQGKFFEMVDLIFKNQTVWEKKPNPKSEFETYAKNLNLDVAQYDKDVDSKEVKDRVQEDLISGNKAGINGTPTFFLNGKKLDNINSFDDFVKLLKNPK